MTVIVTVSCAINCDDDDTIMILQRSYKPGLLQLYKSFSICLSIGESSVAPPMFTVGPLRDSMVFNPFLDHDCRWSCMMELKSNGVLSVSTWDVVYLSKLCW